MPASQKPPLSELAEIDIHHLANQVVIRHEKDSTQQRLDTLLRRYELRIKEQFEVSLATSAGQLVHEGCGIAITDPFTARQFERMGETVIKPLCFSLPFEFQIISPASRPANRNSHRLIQLFIHLAQEMGIALTISPIREIPEHSKIA